MSWLQSFFSTPARQALGWTLLGILGIGMATGGVFFLTDDGGGSRTADADSETPAPTNTPTATPTRTSTLSPSPTASPTPTETPTATPTTRPIAAANPGGNTGGGNNGDGSAQEPAPTPTPEPVVAGGDFCPPSSTGPASGTLPSGRVAGAVTVGGVDAAEGTVDIFVAFDGVLGGSTKNITGAFRIDFYAGPSNCANRVGAAISVFANGQFFATGRSVGDGGGQLIPVTVALP